MVQKSKDMADDLAQLYQNNRSSFRRRDSDHLDGNQEETRRRLIVCKFARLHNGTDGCLVGIGGTVVGRACRLLSSANLDALGDSDRRQCSMRGTIQLIVPEAG